MGKKERKLLTPGKPKVQKGKVIVIYYLAQHWVKFTCFSNVGWDSWMDRLISFIKFRKFSATFSPPAPICFSVFPLFVYLFLTAQGLRCCSGVFSSCARASHCSSFSCCGAWALECAGFSSCGAGACLLHGTWHLPPPGFEPVFPALAGRFLTTETTKEVPFLVFGCFAWHVSSLTTDWTGTLRGGGTSLNQWTPREAPVLLVISYL